ncbi:hypothetical protein Adt_42142 [Abeliophyllum distichum]|uniref:Uncharacterized protein n=1 Tax=Abeliophyllum distichum TaxID=126358 RepID=A0ABD1PQU7_9LAMI
MSTERFSESFLEELAKRESKGQKKRKRASATARSDSVDSFYAELRASSEHPSTKLSPNMSHKTEALRESRRVSAEIEAFAMVKEAMVLENEKLAIEKYKSFAERKDSEGRVNRRS